MTLSNNLLNKTQKKAQTIKGKNDEFDWINIKDFWVTKGTMDKVNRWVSFWEKIYRAFLNGQMIPMEVVYTIHKKFLLQISSQTLQSQKGLPWLSIQNTTPPLLKKKIIYLFYNYVLPVLGLCCCAWAFSSYSESGYSSLSCAGFAWQWLLLLLSMGSRVKLQQLWLLAFIAPQHVGSSQTRDRTSVPSIARWILNNWNSKEAPSLL